MEPAQPLIFQDMSDASPVRMVPAGVWTEDMTQRLRVLYHARPIFEMFRGLAHSEEASSYDVAVLGFKLLDILAEETGLGDGVSAESLVAGALPLLVAEDIVKERLPNDAVHRRVVRRVLDYLLNRGDNTRQFVYDYLDCEGELPVKRTLSFRLVEEVYGPRGGIVLRLTPAAVNLMFRMLAVDLESTMAATEAILEHLLKRGRFDQALQSAQKALQQAGFYRIKIRAFRQNVRSDIHLEIGSGSLGEAMAFIQERQEKDRVLSGQIQARQDDLRQKGMGQEEVDSKYRALAEIGDLINQCSALYASLGLDIMDAQREFTLEHARQSLRAKTRYQRCPNLMTDKAPRIFGAPMAAVEQGLLAFHQRLAGYGQPERFSFAYILAPLKRPLPDPDAAGDTEEVPILLKDPYIAAILPEDWEWAHRFLEGLEGRKSLNELLAMAAKDDKLEGPRRLAILIEVMRAFAFGKDKPGVKLYVEKAQSAPVIRWKDIEFYGDDLWIEPLVEEVTVQEEEGA